MKHDALFVQARVVARDLGLPAGDDPLASILRYCDRQIHTFLNQFPCRTLSELLSLVANKLSTKFYEIDDDEALERLAADFRSRGEAGFADIRHHLAPDVFGITIRLQNPRPGELRFVSVIDCRGPKASRRYFTKWHELAHLFVLTDQARLQFFRTHDVRKSAEEQVVDKIAGNYSLYRPFIAPHLNGQLTFAKIQDVRAACCPEASLEATMIGVISAWPAPVVFINAKPALKRAEQDHQAAGQLSLLPQPEPTLRAVRVVLNDPARALKMHIFENMRVPSRSIISRVFLGQSRAEEAVEDLSWWEANGSGPLPPRPVIVRSRRTFDGSEAIVTPI